MANRTNSGSSSTSASANHNDGSISSTQVWSAAYAGVEVFQQLYNGTAVMRRRKDSYVNVTQILKCAQYDKPHRTRFLEREIHTGIHEKVQGGYGKYQGTWVPLDRAISLAKQLSVYDALKHVLEYNPAPGEKPPTAPRSLESLRKRKSATLKTSAPSSATKRRASGTLRRYPSSSSLSSILNKPSDQNMHPATPSHAQPPPSHYYTPSNNTAALPPATPNSQQLPSGTPTSGAAMSWRAGPYTPAARRSGNVHNGSLANGPSHLIFMTPETPASNTSSVLHQHSSMTPTGGSAAKYQGSFRVSMPDRNDLASPMMHRGPLPVTPSSAGNAYTTPTRALRDISNTYTDTTPVQGYVKGPPLNAKPSSTLDMNGSALMTPPSSTSVRRAGALGNARSMHTMSPTSMQSTATAQSGGSRPPPPPVFGHYPPNASPLGNEIGGMPRLGLPNHSASSSPGRANYHMSTAASMTSRPARSYSGSIGSISLSTPNHSRSASTVSQPQEFFGNSHSHSHSHSNSNYSSGCQALPSREPFESGVMQGNTGLALSATAVLDFLSGLRRHQSLPNVVGSVLSDPSFEPSKVVADDSNTLLHLATQNGHWDVIQILLDRGVDPGVMNREGKTPLMVAVQSTLAWQNRSAHTFQWLLDVFNSALVNRDKQGRTAVHWACTRPIDAPANWPDVSLYYTRSLVLKLYQCNNLQVLSWEDYLHRSANQLASLAHLAPVTSLLASACQNPVDPCLIQSVQALLAIPESQTANGQTPNHSLTLPPIPPFDQNKMTMHNGVDRSRGAASGAQRIPSISAIGSDDAVVQGQSKLPLGRYDVAANRAIDIINATTHVMRKEHEAQGKALDDDSEYAAQLLLELRTERDALKEETTVHEKLAEQCEVIRDQELSLKHRISSVICMQQSARVSLAMQPSLTASTTPAVPGSPLTEKASDEDLRAEYLRLRAQANGYHANSLKLADEYAELASVVKPWPRPPALSLVGMFDDDDEDVNALTNSGSLWVQQHRAVANSRTLQSHREVVEINSESADIQAINAALEVDEQRLKKFERVVAAACGDMALDRVRDVVGPVLSVLNNGNTL